MSGDFDWNDVEDEILVWQQPTTAVYFNPRGHLVIRQQAEIFEDDAYVLFDMAHLPALIERLQSVLIEAGLGDDVLDRPESVPPAEVRQHFGTRQPPKPPSPGAERQRRYKQRQRHPGDGKIDAGDATGDGRVTAANDRDASPLFPVEAAE